MHYITRSERKFVTRSERKFVTGEDTSFGARSRGSRSTKSELMQEQMSAKRRLDELMVAKVVGTSRSLSIVHFTREFVLDSQGGGWTGVLLLTDGKATFTLTLRTRPPSCGCARHALHLSSQSHPHPLRLRRTAGSAQGGSSVQRLQLRRQGPNSTRARPSQGPSGADLG